MEKHVHPTFILLSSSYQAIGLEYKLKWMNRNRIRGKASISNKRNLVGRNRDEDGEYKHMQVEVRRRKEKKEIKKRKRSSVNIDK